MNQKDRKRYQDCLLKTKAVLPGPNLSKEDSLARDLVFWEVLENYSIESVEEAFWWALRNLSFFPTPKDIINHIEGSGELEKFPEISWQGPTEEGKQMARECLTFVLNKIEEREKKENEARAKRFEERRAFLKNQAKDLPDGT